MSGFRIGEFEFINLSRALSQPTQRLVREVRSGVDGATFWKTGKRAEPLVVVSVADAATVAAAEALLHQYEQLVGGDPVTVTWGNVALDAIKVVVLDVQPLDGGVHTMLLGIGGVTGGQSHGLCRAAWLLNPIDPGQ